MIYLRDMIALAPEFATLEPLAIQAAIDDAVSACDVGFWGYRLDTAIKYLAAHYIAVSYPGLGSPGVVAEERVGPIIRKYAVGIPSMDDELQTTRFGRRYLQMIKDNPSSHFGVV